jgi:hypothetical protein
MPVGGIDIQISVKVGVEGPEEFTGAMVGTIMQRRGIVISQEKSEGFAQLECSIAIAPGTNYVEVFQSETNRIKSGMTGGATCGFGVQL